ncbi:MAG: HsdR family type I site-specific deoxyribonuclease [Acidobacteria bacterium]|nr:MAG: HsdR family type I site-specific deoxyribonuclease [Acidobacteriota bacterium]MCE7957140.1 HsdR family type I site-specific deoxyribonuclease [Acidobacteria bacterium ACB2]
MPSLANERFGVQNPLIRYAGEVGWTILSRDEAITERGGESGTLLYKTLERKLLELNPGVVTPENVVEVVSRIENVRTNIEGNAEVLAWLRGERTVYVAAEKRHRNVTLVDYEHLAHNAFHVTDEWRYTNGQHANRADVMFTVNGIPAALVETKGATKSDAIDVGIEQVRRYHRETPELLAAPQVFDVTRLVDFFYGVTWNLDRKGLFNWKDEETGNFERKVKRFFGRERFLKLLRDWIIFYKRDDELRKIVLRQHQTRAVEKVVDRALDPEKRHGLVWHTQGSGKTFTMITAAEQILEHPALKNEKPTVLMLVDRNELEGQLFQNLTAYGLPYEQATSKKRLRELLQNDYRGLIVAMVHKFEGADADLSTRENVFVLVDEAHRTTGGDLGNYLVAALPNATYIGFTGTPIDKTAYGKGTFKVFGVDDPKGYLDKYSIAESIADGTTLPLHYTLAPNEMRVPKEQLEKEFLSITETEGVSDIEELNKILDRAVNLKTFMKAADRVEKVAAFVAAHFKENVEPLGYKSFLVGVDREACALYKHALDKHLPPEYSTVVYTSAHNDPELLTEFKLDEDAEKQLRKAFTKSEKLPKILIVTEKLLTGFDAPVLYCMYLDKPMRDHTLLQAIARVNRPYEENGSVKKPAGFVLDFVGIFENLQKALSFDSDVVASVIQNIDVLKQRFESLMATQAPVYLEFCGGWVDDKAVERAIEGFSDKERREVFYSFFKEIETLYEIISPDAFLRPHIDAYAKLSVLYNLLRSAYGKQVSLVKDLMRKTEALVREHATAEGFTGALPLVTIDEEALSALKRDGGSATARVINLGRTIVDTVAKEGQEQPFLVPIGDRVQAVLEFFDDRQLSTGEAVSELEKLVREYLDAKKEREKLALDEHTFAVLQVLKRGSLDSEKALALAGKLQGVFAKYPEHRENAGQLRLLKAELYKHLLPSVGRKAMVETAESLLRIARG